jgi:mercuric ion transport protein
MKAALGAIGAAVGASACCIGPVAFSLAGVGALGASAVRLEPYRPWFIAITVACVGLALYGAHRPLPSAPCSGGTCEPASRRRARIIAWLAAAIAAFVIAFPYYIGWFV